MAKPYRKRARDMTMSKPRAFAVLRAMDMKSTARFSEEEREAIITLGASYKMGHLTDSEHSEFERIIQWNSEK